MQNFAENNPRKWLRNRVQLTERQEVTKGFQWCTASLLKTTKGAGVKLGTGFHSREEKTSTSQNSYSAKVQSSPGERRNLIGGHGEDAVLVAAPKGRYLNEITSAKSMEGHSPEWYGADRNDRSCSARAGDVVHDVPRRGGRLVFVVQLNTMTSKTMKTRGSPDGEQKG